MMSITDNSNSFNTHNETLDNLGDAPNRSTLYWIPIISNELAKAEDLLNEMLDSIEEFHRYENKNDLKIRSRGSLYMDDVRKPSTQRQMRRQQIFGEINDIDAHSTRVNVVINLLTDRELDDLIDSMQSCFASEGDSIIKEGDYGDVFYILEKGICDITINGNSVQRLEDGSFFGDLALMYNCPRQATVTALTDCTLWTLDRMFFRRAMVVSSSNQTQQLSQFLSKIALFENLSEQTINQLARSLSKQTFHDGEYIIRQGEIGDRLYLISRGTVRVTVTGDNSSEETVLNLLSEGEIFGERALIKQEPRKANCICEGICECYYLNSQDFVLMLGEIVDKLNELDDFRMLRSLPLFSKLSVPRLLQVKKTIKYQTIYYGRYLQCDPDMIYIVMDGYVETKNKRKYGPRGTIGDIDFKHDILGDTLTSMARESRIGIISRYEIINQIQQQYENATSDDAISRSGSIEQVLVKAIKTESYESEDNVNTYSLRRKSTAIKRRESSNSFICHNLDDLEILRILGKGTFGDVYLALNKRNQSLVALKCLDKKSLVQSCQHNYVQREILAMQSFNHPFIGSYYGMFLSPRKIMFLLEYISGGELWRYLYRQEDHHQGADKSTYGLPVYHVCLYSSIILLALEHIHQLGYCYRDLKPENVLITNKGYLKLVDFGFAKAVPFINKNQRTQYRTFTLCGTAEYMAPEIVLTQGHDKSVDCWAFGIFIFELLNGFTPFEGRNQQRTFEKIVYSQKYLSFHEGFDSHAKSLIRRLLHPNPALRLGALQNGFDDVKKQAFFITQNINFDMIYNQEIRMPYIPDDNNISDDQELKDSLNLQEEATIQVENDFNEYFSNLSQIDISNEL